MLFVRSYNNGSVTLMMAKVKDYLMMIVKLAVMEEIVDALKKRFQIIKSVIDQNIRFNDCLIRLESTGDVVMKLE